MGEGSASRPGHNLPTRKTRYPLYSRLGGPQGRSGQVWKISPPPGFDPRTVQLVGSRYTNYAIPPTDTNVITRLLLWGCNKRKWGQRTFGIALSTVTILAEVLILLIQTSTKSLTFQIILSTESQSSVNFVEVVSVSSKLQLLFKSQFTCHAIALDGFLRLSTRQTKLQI